eukprot:NODE_220_length_12432_cov_0.484878.p7 type:complete len:130 gc:universal NODE_220_length_12432_cov_0.484878:9891-10280(+)
MVLETIIITKAICIVGKLLPILQNIEQTCDNNDKATKLCRRFKRLNFVLKKMASKTFSETTMDTLQHLLSFLGTVDLFLQDFKDFSYIRRFLLNANYNKKMTNFDSEIDKIISELIVSYICMQYYGFEI